MEEEIVAIVSRITKISVDELYRSMNVKNLWKSLTHVELVFALEEKYGIVYTSEEIGGTKTLEELIITTKKKAENK